MVPLHFCHLLSWSPVDECRVLSVVVPFLTFPFERKRRTIAPRLRARPVALGLGPAHFFPEPTVFSAQRVAFSAATRFFTRALLRISCLHRQITAAASRHLRDSSASTRGLLGEFNSTLYRSISASFDVRFPGKMDNMYTFWGLVDGNRRTHTDVQEDQSWKMAATKLAFADQMRLKFDKARSDTKIVSPHEKNIKQGKGRSKNRSDEMLKGEGYNQKFNDEDLRYGDMGHKLGAGNMASSQIVSSTDKRFKSLPAAETLPRLEALGGYIFVCNNDTMAEDLKRQLFGLPQRYRDSVRAIQPGLPLFLYNYTTHQLHGVYEAASFGGSNIDPTAWEDKKCKGESRFPAQVRSRVRKLAKPLEEDAFRPVLYHYDGPKFRLQLSVPETLALLDLFKEAGMA